MKLYDLDDYDEETDDFGADDAADDDYYGYDDDDGYTGIYYDDVPDYE